MIPAPADLPECGIQFGADAKGLPVFLGDAGHEWLVGATGAGKTGFLAAIRSCLENDTPFAVLDPHGP